MTQRAARPRHGAGLGSRRARWGAGRSWASRACGRRGAGGSMQGSRGGQRTSRLTRRRQWRARRAGQACGRALGVRAEARARSRERRRAAGARGAAGWALLCAPGCASWASWVLVHPAWFSTRFFRLDIFPESLNEHCSL